MKPPKLPGTEKFKFSDKKYSDSQSSRSATITHNNDTNASNFIRGIPSRSTCPSNSSVPVLTTEQTLNRYDSKRRPILPISSRMTSRVLTLTQLSLDSFDIRDRDLHSYKRSSKGHNSYLSASVTPVSCTSRTSTTTSTSRLSLFSDSLGSHCSSEPSPRSLSSPLDRSHWANSAHRLSTSSQSSWEDGPESIWVSTK